MVHASDKFDMSPAQKFVKKEEDGTYSCMICGKNFQPNEYVIGSFQCICHISRMHKKELRKAYKPFVYIGTCIICGGKFKKKCRVEEDANQKFCGRKCQSVYINRIGSDKARVRRNAMIAKLTVKLPCLYCGKMNTRMRAKDGSIPINVYCSIVCIRKKWQANRNALKQGAKDEREKQVATQNVRPSGAQPMFARRQPEAGVPTEAAPVERKKFDWSKFRF